MLSPVSQLVHEAWQKGSSPRAPLFGALNGSYDSIYAANDRHYNGVLGDTFVLKSLQEAFPNPDGVKVLDIGSGDGRNANTIALHGYFADGLELSEKGRELAAKRAETHGVSDRVAFLDADILNPPETLTGPYDFAFMSHVSQHFDLEELHKTVSNVARILTNGGQFIFDALIRRPGFEELLKRTGFDHANGSQHFSREEIETLAAAENLQSSIAPYNEPPISQGKYVSQAWWGFQTPDFSPPRPLDLQWVVLKKAR